MRNHGLKASLLSTCLLLLAGTALLAQAWSGRARMQGEVDDANGKPLEGAKVTLRLGDAGPPPISTNSRGKWSILGLADGSWKVLIEKEGYVTSEGQVKISEFQPTQPINIRLRETPKEEKKPAAPSEAEIINGWIDQGNSLMTEAANGYEACVAHPPAGVKPAGVKEACQKQVAPKYDQVRTLYQQAYDKADAKNKPAILGGIARVYDASGNTPKAIETLKQVVELNPDDQADLKLLVDMLIASGRETEAKPYEARLPAGTTVDPNALLNLGIAAYNAKKADAALGYFDRVVKEHPDMAEAYYYRGLVYLQQGKTAESKADFQKLLEIDPKNAHASEVREFLKSL